MKKLNLFALCLISLLVVFTGCGEDDDDNRSSAYVVDANVVDGSGLNIDSVLMEYNFLDIATQKVERLVLSRTNYLNGGFTINLPKTINSIYLTKIKEAIGTDSQLEISNHSAQILSSPSFVAYKDGQRIGHFDYGNDTDTRASYVYADRYFKMFGNTVVNDVEENFKYIYKNYFSKGWNILRQKNYPDGKVNVIEFSTNHSEGLKWYYVEESYASGI